MLRSFVSLDDDFTCVIVRSGKATMRWEISDRKFSSSLGSLEDIRQFVGATALECGLDGGQIDSLQIATHEAVTNVVRHAHQNEPGLEVEIRVERLDKGIRLSGTDLDIAVSTEVTADVESAGAEPPAHLVGLGHVTACAPALVSLSTTPLV
jgi:hypothetical protein